MSKAAKDGNNFRREWDKEAFEARAKARLEAELSLEDERESRKTEPGVIVQRAPLQRRTEDLQIAKYVGTRQVITGAQALAGAGAYYCKVCECHLRDSANYLAHINGKKHNRMLGMSMRAERSTLGEVRARLEAHKQDRDDREELPPEEKAQRFLEAFDERVRANEDAARAEAAEKRRLARATAAEREEEEARQQRLERLQRQHVATGGAAEVDESWEAEDSGDMAAAMGFGGFGGSKKSG